MITLESEIEISAPIERVFDLARSIDAHVDSSSATREVAVAGRTTGLIELGETVTWSAVHFGIRQRLTVEIIDFNRPYSFTDRMISGAFKTMEHRHDFEQVGDRTVMKDRFRFEAPFGIIGTAVERVVLQAYMKRFLDIRNQRIKHIAESAEWKRFLLPEDGP